MVSIGDLTHMLNGWFRWMRIRRAAIWALRGLIGGFALSLALGLAGMFQARLLRPEFLAFVGLSTLLFSLGGGLVAYLWPIHPLKAARYFDRIFGLRERVSTALELGRAGDPQRDGALTQRQLEDAVNAARAVRPAQALPLRLQLREGLLVLILLSLLGLTWLQGDRMFQAAQQARAVQQAAAVQSQKIEQLLSQVQNDPTLSEEQKRALSAPLEQALNGLKENPSLEGSVSTLTSAGEKLQALSGPQAQQMSQALKNAGSQAAAQDGSPLQSVGQKLADGKTVAAASDLANIDPGKLDQQQAGQLADQLQSMAQSLAATNPQLASSLNDAAQALRNEDSAAAQQALQQAAQQMAQSGQQQAFSQTANQAAQQMQQGAGQVLAAGGGQQQAAQPGQGQQGQQGQNGAQNGQQQGAPGGGQGAGSGAGTGQSGSSPIPQGNGPGDGGEKPYEQIYAPNLLGGKDGQSVDLPSSGQNGGDTTGQGPSTSSNPGENLVPYEQVYSAYNEINNQAIENGSIPFEFIEIIKNYFDSLRP